MPFDLNSIKLKNAKNAFEIANSFSEFIEAEELRAGDKLPPIRTLARLLRISPSTIASAYANLERQGMVRANGRQGTTVVKRSQNPTRARVFQMIPDSLSTLANDLSTGFPDVTLLPNLQNALISAISYRTTQNFLNRSVCEDLTDPLDQLFKNRSGSRTIVNGSLDALDRILDLHCKPGDRVVVEEPNFPPIFDLLDVHGLIAIPVFLDDQGIDPESLKKAIATHPKVMIIQPRSQNPTGISTSKTRLDELANILKTLESLLIIEDDHSGMISSSPQISLDQYFPDRTVTIFGFSKSHGPDLRIAAVIGPPGLVSALIARRRLGPSWTSEIVQRMLAYYLTDPDSILQLEKSKDSYQDRLLTFTNLLRGHGFEVSSFDGLNVWVPISSTVGAITDLARNGIVVAPGNAFFLTDSGPPHLRITTATLETVPVALVETLLRWI